MFQRFRELSRLLISQLGKPNKLPYFVLIGGLILSFFVALQMHENNKRAEQSHLQNLVFEFEHSIRERLIIYENVLWGGASLFEASKSVEQGEWKSYVDSLKIFDRYPGIQGLGVIVPVAGSEVKNYQERIQNNDFLNEGISSKSSAQLKTSDHYVITYVEPLSSNQVALGYDVGSEMNRRQAAESSRDSGQSIMTDEVTLVQNQKKGFLLFRPFYEQNFVLEKNLSPEEEVNERRSKIIGWIYAPFVMQDFFENILLGRSREIGLKIYQNNPRKIIFERDATGLVEKTTELWLAGKKLTIEWNRTDTFSRPDDKKNLLFLISTILIAFLLSGIIRLLQQTNEKAQKIAEQITQELKTTQEQLLESQKLEAIGKLAGGVAHDFNNILGSIMGYASMLKEKFSSDEKVTRQLSIMINAAERGSRLTKDLLGFARKGNYEKKSIHLNAIVEEAVHILGSTIDKRILLKHDLSKNLWGIEGDSTQILQVILNLGVNSKDAMPDGGEIVISSRNETFDIPPHETLKPGKYVHLIFEDTGTGIPKEIRNKIYDPFFTTKAQGKGTGLGLSMIYGIVKNHGGHIVLDDTPSQGTRFHLYFPALETATFAQVVVAQAQDTSKTSLFNFENLKGKSVLIVDDEASMVAYLQDCFQSLGFVVHCLYGGETVLEALQKHPVDLIVMDVMMPEHTGIEVYENLRKNKIITPVIFASGYAESEKIAAIRKQDNVLFLQKPFQKTEIVESVLKALQQ